MVKRIFNDWAVTLQVHPWALGIVTQEQGNATIPADLNVVCEIVPNFFNNESISHTIRGTEVSIPSRINKMTVSTKRNFVLRAVVVTEHRNVDFASTVSAGSKHAPKGSFRDSIVGETGQKCQCTCQELNWTADFRHQTFHFAETSIVNYESPGLLIYILIYRFLRKILKSFLDRSYICRHFSIKFSSCESIW